MSLDQEAIDVQLQLLASHRQRLVFLLQQQAKLGAYTPPYVHIDIQEAQSAIRRIKEQLRADGVPVEDEPNDDVQPAAAAPPSRLSPQEQRNRRVMLAKVKTIWIDGLLEQSLAKELRIALDLTEQPDAVDLPLNALVQELNHPPRPLPAGTPIIRVFEQMGGALLILGAPGAGKTTLLLELARDLIERAERDEGHPIPVVFNLSAWAEKRRPLREWLVEELNTKYDVPKKTAQGWINTDAILPLLDGLDEVAANQRGDCVAAINTYREEYDLVPLAVCSRVADYEVLTVKLRLQGAVIVQVLTQQQIEAYLERAGEKLAGVRAALEDNVELSDLLNTPLMLSIVTLAYKYTSPVKLRVIATVPDRWRQLFDDYLTAMFRRRHEEVRFTPKQTMDSLAWLAHAMTQQGQSVFLIEQLQPEWLPSQKVRLQYTVLDRLMSGLLFALVGALAFAVIGGLIFRLYAWPDDMLVFGLVCGLIAPCFGGQRELDIPQQRRMIRIVFDAIQGWLVVGLYFGLAFGLRAIHWRLGNGVREILVGLLVYGLIGGLLGMLTGRPSLRPRNVIVTERLHWSAKKALLTAISGLGTGLSVGLCYWLIFNSLGALILSSMVMFIFGLVGGLHRPPLSTTIRPNQGTWLSAYNALLGGLGIGLSSSLVFGLGVAFVSSAEVGLKFGVIFGLIFGFLGSLSFGGYSFLSHLCLRLVLYRNGSLPLRLVPFLDYCTERIFLRKVGGGYIFVHRLLMEHFAELERGTTE